jgi:hypothetical protein
MADVSLTVQDCVVTGLAPSYTGSLSTENTYQVQNNGRVFLHFKKTGAGECTVTITTPVTKGGLAVADRTLTVPATTGDKMIGPFPPSIYNNSSGLLEFTASEVTDLSVAAVRL